MDPHCDHEWEFVGVRGKDMRPVVGENTEECCIAVYEDRKMVCYECNSTTNQRVKIGDCLVPFEPEARVLQAE